MVKKRAKRRPKNVLAAGNEINKLGMDIVQLALEGKLPKPLHSALSACLGAHGKVHQAAIMAAGVAALRVCDEEKYTDPWPRQWRRTTPPQTTDEIMHEAPLWYQARILQSMRFLLTTDSGGAWDSSPDDWRRIGAAMRMAKNAIAGGSLEARTQAGTRMREARTEQKKNRGPQQKPVALATVSAIHG